MVLAGDLDRNREPSRATGGLDSIPVAPVSARVLDIVEQNELIHRVDQVEVALPRNVTGLNDGGPPDRRSDDWNAAIV